MWKCGWFFFRATTLISTGKSLGSGVRGLVVRCLLFNPDVSCSNRCECVNFFTSIPKQKGRPFHFFRHYETSPPFRLCETLFRKFSITPKAPLQFFDILQQIECLKNPKGSYFRFFGTETVQNYHFFVFFFSTSSFNFLIFYNRMV